MFLICFSAEQSCTRTTNVNNTYFVNPGYPDTTSSLGVCEMTVKRRTKDICQIRLDFIDFELEQPGRHGDCYNDYFTVNGTKTEVPVLCGNNSGQHSKTIIFKTKKLFFSSYTFLVYLEVDPQKIEDDVTLRVRIEELTLLIRKWSINISMIECSSQEKGSFLPSIVNIRS